MAQLDVLLPGIEHEQQDEFYLCGPACINMVLSYWDKHDDTDTIWAEVQGNSGTASRPTDAPEDDGSFNNQVCEKCATAGVYHCWYTSPEAMAATISGRAPETFAAGYIGATKVFEALADSLSATPPIPAAFTTAPDLHWVTAVGYQLDGLGSAHTWSGKKLTGFYVRNPSKVDPGSDITHIVTIAGLYRPLTGLLMSVQCGAQAGLYPVVVKATPSSGGGGNSGGGGGNSGGGGDGETGVLDLFTRLWSTFLRFAYRPWRFFMPGRDPRNPGPPPRNRGGGG